MKLEIIKPIDDRLSFRHWVFNHTKIADTVEGDFISDARQELKAGRGWVQNDLASVLASIRRVLTERELAGRLTSTREDYLAAEEAAAAAWLRYRRWLQRQARK